MQNSHPSFDKTVVTGPGQKQLFVKLAATENWLMMAVTGSKSSTSIQRTSLLTTLRTKIEGACRGELTAIESPVAESCLTRPTI